MTATGTRHTTHMYIRGFGFEFRFRFAGDRDWDVGLSSPQREEGKRASLVTRR